MDIDILTSNKGIVNALNYINIINPEYPTVEIAGCPWINFSFVDNDDNINDNEYTVEFDKYLINKFISLDRKIQSYTFKQTQEVLKSINSTRTHGLISYKLLIEVKSKSSYKELPINFDFGQYSNIKLEYDLFLEKRYENDDEDKAKLRNMIPGHPILIDLYLLSKNSFSHFYIKSRTETFIKYYCIINNISDDLIESTNANFKSFLIENLKDISEKLILNNPKSRIRTTGCCSLSIKFILLIITRMRECNHNFLPYFSNNLQTLYNIFSNALTYFIDHKHSLCLEPASVIDVLSQEISQSTPFKPFKIYLGTYNSLLNETNLINFSNIDSVTFNKEILTSRLNSISNDELFDQLNNFVNAVEISSDDKVMYQIVINDFINYLKIIFDPNIIHRDFFNFKLIKFYINTFYFVFEKSPLIIEELKRNLNTVSKRFNYNLTKISSLTDLNKLFEQLYNDNLQFKELINNDFRFQLYYNSQFLIQCFTSNAAVNSSNFMNQLLLLYQIIDKTFHAQLNDFIKKSFNNKKVDLDYFRESIDFRKLDNINYIRLMNLINLCGENCLYNHLVSSINSNFESMNQSKTFDEFTFIASLTRLYNVDSQKLSNITKILDENIDYNRFMDFLKSNAVGNDFTFDLQNLLLETSQSGSAATQSIIKHVIRQHNDNLKKDYQKKINLYVESTIHKMNQQEPQEQTSTINNILDRAFVGISSSFGNESSINIKSVIYDPNALLNYFRTFLTSTPTIVESRLNEFRHVLDINNYTLKLLMSQNKQNIYTVEMHSRIQQIMKEFDSIEKLMNSWYSDLLVDVRDIISLLEDYQISYTETMRFIGNMSTSIYNLNDTHLVFNKIKKQQNKEVKQKIRNVEQISRKMKKLKDYNTKLKVEIDSFRDRINNFNNNRLIFSNIKRDRSKKSLIEMYTDLYKLLYGDPEANDVSHNSLKKLYDDISKTILNAPISINLITNSDTTDIKEPNIVDIGEITDDTQSGLENLPTPPGNNNSVEPMEIDNENNSTQHINDNNYDNNNTHKINNAFYNFINRQNISSTSRQKILSNNSSNSSTFEHLLKFASKNNLAEMKVKKINANIEMLKTNFNLYLSNLKYLSETVLYTDINKLYIKLYCKFGETYFNKYRDKWEVLISKIYTNTPANIFKLFSNNISMAYIDARIILLYNIIYNLNKPDYQLYGKQLQKLLTKHINILILNYINTLIGKNGPDANCENDTIRQQINISQENENIRLIDLINSESVKNVDQINNKNVCIHQLLPINVFLERLSLLSEDSKKLLVVYGLQTLQKGYLSQLV